MAPFSVLISSVSRKVPLVKQVRKGLERAGLSGEVIGGDSNPNAIARHFVDKFWEMAPIDQLDPEDHIRYCLENEVKAVIPTRDGELLYYAENRKRFEAEGVHVMVGNPKGIQSCLDKFQFYHEMKDRGGQAVPSSDTIEALQGSRFVVKERYGAGGRGIQLDLSKTDAREAAKNLNHPLFQPFIEGKESSVDLFLDKSGKAVSAICRERVLVVNGESRITSTYKDRTLEELCCSIAERLNLSGHAVFQVIKNEQGYWIIECNPRFGGASTLSIEVGLDSFTWFFLETAGKPLPQFIRGTEKTLIRYPEDMIIE